MWPPRKKFKINICFKMLAFPHIYKTIGVIAMGGKKCQCSLLANVILSRALSQLYPVLPMESHTTDLGDTRETSRPGVPESDLTGKRALPPNNT